MEQLGRHLGWDFGWEAPQPKEGLGQRTGLCDGGTPLLPRLQIHRREGRTSVCVRGVRAVWAGSCKELGAFYIGLQFKCQQWTHLFPTATHTSTHPLKASAAIDTG